jgi:hypothetical protein
LDVVSFGGFQMLLLAKFLIVAFVCKKEFITSVFFTCTFHFFSAYKTRDPLFSAQNEDPKAPYKLVALKYSVLERSELLKKERRE